MRKMIEAIETLARIGIGVAFGVLMMSVVIQLAARGGWIPVQIWTEEAARFCLLYIAALGAGLAFRSGDMVNVGLVSESAAGKRLRSAFALAAAAVRGAGRGRVVPDPAAVGMVLHLDRLASDLARARDPDGLDPCLGAGCVGRARTVCGVAGAGHADRGRRRPRNQA